MVTHRRQQSMHHPSSFEQKHRLDVLFQKEGTGPNEQQEARDEARRIADEYGYFTKAFIREKDVIVVRWPFYDNSHQLIEHFGIKDAIDGVGHTRPKPSTPHGPCGGQPRVDYPFYDYYLETEIRRPDKTRGESSVIGPFHCTLCAKEYARAKELPVNRVCRRQELSGNGPQLVPECARPLTAW